MVMALLRRWLYTPIIIWQCDWIPRVSKESPKWTTKIQDAPPSVVRFPKKSPTVGPTVHGPRKSPEYLITRASNLLYLGVRWDSVPFNFWWIDVWFKDLELGYETAWHDHPSFKKQRWLNKKSHFNKLISNDTWLFLKLSFSSKGVLSFQCRKSDSSTPLEGHGRHISKSSEECLGVCFVWSEMLGWKDGPRS